MNNGIDRILNRVKAVSPELGAEIARRVDNNAGHRMGATDSKSGWDVLKDAFKGATDLASQVYADKERAKAEAEKIRAVAMAEAQKLQAQLEMERLNAIRNQQAQLANQLAQEQAGVQSFISGVSLEPWQMIGLAGAGILTLLLVTGAFRGR